MYARRTLPAGGFCTWQPFMSHQQRWTDTTAPEKKMLPTPPFSLVEWSTGPVSVSLPTPTNEAVGLSQAAIDNRLVGLLDP
jgi:hypothetical protein